MLKDDMFHHFVLIKLPQTAFEEQGSLLIPVNREDGQFVLVLPGDRDCFQQGNIGKVLTVVAWGGDDRLQNPSPSVQGSMEKWIEDGLAPGRTPGLGHNRGDNIYQLRQAGDFHPVGMS